MTIATLLALAGCQTLPAKQASFSLPPVADRAAMGAVSVSITAERSSRSVQATVADVEQIQLRLDAGFTSVLKTVDRATLSAGTVTLSFGELRAGSARLFASAYDADGKQIGVAGQDMFVKGGATTNVALKLRLEPTVIPGSGQPAGGLSVGFLFDAGPVGAIAEHYTFPAHIGHYQIGPTGQVWIVGTQPAPLNPDGTLGAPLPIPILSNVLVDGNGNWWQSKSSSGVYKYSPQGALLASWPDVSEVMGFGPEDEVWLYDFKKQETVIYDRNRNRIAAVTGRRPVTYNQALDEYWMQYSVMNGLDLTHKRYDRKGAFISEFTTSPMLTPFKMDPVGNMWSINFASERVEKYSPDGTLLGTFRAGVAPLDFAFDKAGQAWVISGSPGENNITCLSPTGAVVGRQTVDFTPMQIEADSLGNIWVKGWQLFVSIIHLAKIVP